MSNNHKTITKRPRSTNRIPFSFATAEARAVYKALAEDKLTAEEESLIVRVMVRLGGQLRRSAPAAVAQRADAAFEAQVFDGDLPAIAGESAAAE